ncbi:MAG TPA: hypothetical protein VL334_17650 [Anaerolineae bacterium]|nr:hypothetical protein [Anaerolineae bacterium]
MARPSIIPSVRLRLEEYLEQHEAEYLAQPEATRKPTLPYTGDFKVNVRALAEAIGLKQTQEKYLYEREELFSLVNLTAEGQGLLPIGARTQPQIDKSIRERLIMQATGARVDAQAAVESKAREEALTEALALANSQNADLRAENTRLRARLEMVQNGMLARVDE